VNVSDRWQTDRQTDKLVGDVARDAASFVDVVYTAQPVLWTEKRTQPQTLPDNKGRL